MDIKAILLLHDAEIYSDWFNLHELSTSCGFFDFLILSFLSEAVYNLSRKKVSVL